MSAFYEYRELYFFYSSDCDVCHSVTPDFEQFRTEHTDIVSVMLDTSKFDWQKYGFDPRKVPAYLYAVNRQPHAKFVGALKKAQLERFVAGKMHS